MDFKRESFNEVFKEMVPLLLKHRDEINLFNKTLDPDIDTYLDWEEAGVSRLYTVRDQGELVGYGNFVLFTHNHHKTSLHATQDVLFIKKDKRGHGLDFLKFCEAELKKDGVEVLHQCVPSCNDWGKVLEFKGYHKLETIYIKEL